MSTIAIQYLEHPAGISVDKAGKKLRAAFEILQVKDLLIGWNAPEPLVNMCAEECGRNGAALYRWHPLLTSDGVFNPVSAWYTIGPNHKPVLGFKQLPEFTFICPNRPQVREAVINHIQSIIKNSPYQGIFLDRIRYPSQTAAPDTQLACFCEACERKAALQGLDFSLVRKNIAALLSDRRGVETFVRLLFNPQYPAEDSDSAAQVVRAFLSFRAESVSSFVKDVAAVIQKQGLSVGLDCFSPVLTHAVGQDLRSLAASSDWIKIMSYAHTYGVAGLPYEFIQTINWLMRKKGFTEPEAIRLIAEATQLPIPSTIQELRQKGFSSKALDIETRRALNTGVKTCFAGIELVDQKNITALDDEQIKADLAAFKKAGAAGLVLSWDLWFMPVERLYLIKENFED